MHVYETNNTDFIFTERRLDKVRYKNDKKKKKPKRYTSLLKKCLVEFYLKKIEIFNSNSYLELHLKFMLFFIIRICFLWFCCCFVFNLNITSSLI